MAARRQALGDPALALAVLTEDDTAR